MIDLPDSDPPDDLVQRLRRERGSPGAAFRSRLRGRLAGRAPRPRPEGLRRLIARYAAGGMALLLLGALGAAGAGPFAP